MKSILRIVITILSILPLVVNAQITCDTTTVYATTNANAVCIEIAGRVRYCFTNNYPDHTDNYVQPQFTLSSGNEEYAMCAYPDTLSYFLPLYEEIESTAGCTNNYIFGVLTNGVRLDPSSGEVFEKSDGTNNINWHIEASSTTTTTGVNMGTVNGGHLNSSGEYHYHKAPKHYFINSLGIDGSAHSPIVGYAADGFPIYYKYVNTDAYDTTSAIVGLSSGYSLRANTRSGDGLTAPNGAYDGTYYEDYEYTTTTLDSCNGRYGITPDYPYGTYYYVLTDNYPYIPRCFKGEDLDNSFLVGPDQSCAESKASSQCPKVVDGCLDPFADNYNANANVDDGSCTYTSLPVELINFTVENQGDYAYLLWQTASELNNSHFEIEYSTDGIAFKSIGMVEGTGTTNKKNHYDFLHLVLNHSNYYRLKIVDFDGNFDYSNIIQLSVENSQYSQLKVFPNPTNGLITIKNNTRNTISVKNVYGQIILETNIQDEGQMDLSHLASGIYVISNGIQSKKLVLRK